jgi:hypothetical protein
MTLRTQHQSIKSEKRIHASMKQSKKTARLLKNRRFTSAC